jgi:hypothetical protein
MTDDFYQFIKRARPLIEQAADNAQRRAKTVIVNKYLLWQVRNDEQQRLHFAAWGFQKDKTVKPDRFSPEMTREEFETYLLNRAVWVETEETEPAQPAQGPEVKS